jgi:Uma2 family endonuclease
MRSAQPALQLMTEDEYLAAERAAFERSEYLDGIAYAMAGESMAHGIISTNLVANIHNQLRQSPCQVFDKDIKVRSGPQPQKIRSTKGLYSYPDILAVCGKIETLDDKRDVITNPSLIIEILSPATERFDRGEKWMRYQQWLPSLQDYLLVSQSQPLIEHYARRADGQWIYQVASGIDSTLHLASINCTLRLADVYNRVEFPPPPEEEYQD